MREVQRGGINGPPSVVPRPSQAVPYLYARSSSLTPPQCPAGLRVSGKQATGDWPGWCAPKPNATNEAPGEIGVAAAAGPRVEAAERVNRGATAGPGLEAAERVNRGAEVPLCCDKPEKVRWIWGAKVKAPALVERAKGGLQGGSWLAVGWLCGLPGGSRADRRLGLGIGLDVGEVFLEGESGQPPGLPPREAAEPADSMVAAECSRVGADGGRLRGSPPPPLNPEAQGPASVEGGSGDTVLPSSRAIRMITSS